MKPASKIVINGVLASVILFLLYLTVVSLAESYAHAVKEFFALWYLMVPLVAGFGVQVSLFTYSRHYVKMVKEGAASVGASGGLSTASMIACCAHHLTDALPLLGLTTAALFLTAYQTVFVVLGLLSNLVGITVMLAIIQKHQLYYMQGPLAKIMSIKMTTVRNLVFVVSTIIMVSLGWMTFTSLGASTTAGAVEAITLDSKASEENGLAVAVEPILFSFERELTFKIGLNTHSGDLNFDLTKLAYLQDSNGIVYTPVQWKGSSPGGHHREGELVFPPMSGKPVSMKLVLKGLYGVPSRVFEWRLTK
ncbi:MAG: hypothetical protein HYU39_03650 [Thaumarchaeota archaeon]|nr:hypothetical protein [Nitrososphaerota archaeon]